MPEKEATPSIGGPHKQPTDIDLRHQIFQTNVQAMLERQRRANKAMNRRE